MPVVETHKDVPWSPDQMYALVSDVARYPEFLSWCAGARIRKTETDGPRQMSRDGARHQCPDSKSK